MINFFRNLSLPKQIPADLSLPNCLGLFTLGKRSSPINQESNDYRNRAERKDYTLMGFGNIFTISPTICSQLSR